MPTGKCLWILNIPAQSSLTNGRYTKELLLKQHNFYLNTCWKLLDDTCIPIYMVKTDSVTTSEDSWKRRKSSFHGRRVLAPGVSIRRRTSSSLATRSAYGHYNATSF